MDPLNPLDAQQIVVEYATLLERDIAENRHPARVDSLPYATATIKTAIRTSVRYLDETGQLTSELRDYFETAYTSLADYLDPELVALMKEFRQSARNLESVPAEHRTTDASWRTLTESSRLAAEVARSSAVECAKLRREFRGFLKQPSL